MRLCIFCGRWANSKEHVWPLWLQSADFPLEEGHLTIFVFGRLIMQTLTVRRKPEFNRTRLILEQRQGVPWGKYLLQVWPVKHKRIIWPPPLSFSDAGETLDSLAKRFTNDR